ncbi:MAG TPA: bifunctional DNA-formamidopyrimidine glycosylase/DNA-(apurinic or apyrimidinic site) lyase [Bryobacteraceae bacterium]|nr:bifunctional DNA-formamidopyrimidine glycosylase/DNA-(apurinic or apyrimidinic site) lyase [Bryobacteraceae bacterium]
MPELPEVETVVRTVAARLKGRRLVKVRCTTRKSWAKSVHKAEGQTIHRVRRYGKYILLDLEEGLLAIHLGMTGKLLASGSKGPYTRAALELDDGATVLFDDVRQFGSARWIRQEPAGLGPDALAVSAGEFLQRLRGRKGKIKPLLLNQSFLRGLGNIYADEALFRAGIHPLALAASLSRGRALRLHGAIVEVLSEAVAKGGSTISDYVDADGNRGWFQIEHRVYQRAGQPCVDCGTGIRRILVAQRGTHFCPRCQRR